MGEGGRDEDGLEEGHGLAAHRLRQGSRGRHELRACLNLEQAALAGSPIAALGAFEVGRIFRMPSRLINHDPPQPFVLEDRVVGKRHPEGENQPGREDQGGAPPEREVDGVRSAHRNGAYGSRKRLSGRCNRGRGSGIPVLTSQRDGFLKDVISEPGFEATLRGDVHRELQEPFQVHLQSGVIEKAMVLLQVYKEVDIAVRTGFTPCDRSEDADVGSPVKGGNLENLVLSVSE
jgi:hypothetical protein